MSISGTVTVLIEARKGGEGKGRRGRDICNYYSCKYNGCIYTEYTVHIPFVEFLQRSNTQLGEDARASRHHGVLFRSSDSPQISRQYSVYSCLREPPNGAHIMCRKVVDWRRKKFQFGSHIIDYRTLFYGFNCEIS